MLLPIANKGISQVMDIVTKTNGELGTIGGRIRGLGDQYTALGDQKFAPKDGPRFIGPEDSDGKDPNDDDAAQKQLAADTVSRALNGNAADAAKVNEVLTSISDDQIAGKAALSPEQQLILGQMGYQTHDLSLQQLSDIRIKLGDQKGILANSWQLLSDPDVKVPNVTKTTELFPEVGNPLVAGSRDRLPTSMLGALNDPGVVWDDHTPGRGYFPKFTIPHEGDLQTIAGFVSDGDARFQQGSDLDRSLMDRGAEIVKATNVVDPTSVHDPVLQGIFNSAGRDGVVDHDLIHGDGGKDFLTAIANHGWSDNGAAASTLTDWIDDTATSSNPEAATRAGETAHDVAAFIGDNKDQLLNQSLFGDATVGANNPDLVQGWAEALEPYQGAMVGDPGDTKGFGVLGNPSEGDYASARNVFAVIDSDPTAAKSFNQHAYEAILHYQQDTTDWIKNGHGPDSRISAAGYAGALNGLVNSGADLSHSDPNYGYRRQALEAALGPLTGQLPFIGDVGKQVILDSLLSNGPRVPTESFGEVYNLEKFTVANALLSTHSVPVPPDLQHFMDRNGHLLGPEAVPEAERVKYYDALESYANTGTGANDYGDVLDKFYKQYQFSAGINEGKK